jgi:hypothetical protein
MRQAFETIKPEDIVRQLVAKVEVLTVDLVETRALNADLHEQLDRANAAAVRMARRVRLPAAQRRAA